LDTQPPSGNIFNLSLLLVNSISAADQSAIIVYLVIIFFLLVCSALLAGSEVAFFSLTTKELTLLRKKYKQSAQQIIVILEHPRKLLATILIGNSFVNIGIAILTYTIIHFFELLKWQEVLIETVAVTFILVLFGEVLPKVYASQNNVRVCLAMFAPLRIMSQIFSPLSNFLISFTNIIEKKLLSKKQSEVNTDEINHAIDLALHDKTSKQEMNILKGIAKFGTISVKQIMKARPDILAADYSFNFTELMQFVNDAGYSRIPIFQEDVDTIKGILFTKDLLHHLNQPDNYNWHELIRPPFFVPEHKKIDDLLKEFKALRNHLAIVVDEYGGTVGLVTLEDIMEEIIGDIKDEFDEGEEFNYHKINESTYVFEGKILLNDFCRVMNVSVDFFNDVKGESDTIAGLLLELFGKIPRVNESISYKEYKFTIQHLDRMRIAKVLINIADKI
jgi:gliding motility-associated protein GldE